VAVPALEALLFLRPGPVVRAFGAAAGDEHVLELGRLNPREALKRLDPRGDWWTASWNLVGSLDEGDIAELRSAPPIQELLEFLKRSPAESGRCEHGDVVAFSRERPQCGGSSQNPVRRLDILRDESPRLAKGRRAVSGQDRRRSRTGRLGRPCP
jgi:hypothetical protein